MIKSLLVAAAVLVSSVSHAHTLAYMPNVSGGTINLTDVSCTDGKSLVAEAVLVSGVTASRGCWTYDEPDVVVWWDDGSHYKYGGANITITTYGKSRLK